MALVRQSRLSVMPVAESEFREIVKMVQANDEARTSNDE
jgi:predicted RNA-binding protein with PUA-like domain